MYVWSTVDRPPPPPVHGMLPPPFGSGCMLWVLLWVYTAGEFRRSQGAKGMGTTPRTTPRSGGWGADPQTWIIHVDMGIAHLNKFHNVIRRRIYLEHHWSLGPLGAHGPKSPVGPMGPMRPVGPVGPVGFIGPMGPRAPWAPWAKWNLLPHNRSEISTSTFMHLPSDAHIYIYIYIYIYTIQIRFIQLCCLNTMGAPTRYKPCAGPPSPRKHPCHWAMWGHQTPWSQVWLSLWCLAEESH